MRKLLRAVAAVAVLVTTACGNPLAEPPTGGPAVLPPAATDLDGVTLTVWQSNSLQPGYKTLFADFEKATGARIRSEVFPDPYESTLLTKWATGARPDLMVFQSSAGFLRRLDPARNLFDLSGAGFVAKQRFELAKTAAVLDGKNYGLSLEPPTVFGLWYNKSVLDRAGVRPPTTLAELTSACAAIKRALPGVSPLYDAGGDQWTTQILPFMLWTDALKSGLRDRLNGNRAQWTEPALVDALAAYRSLVEQGCFNADLRTGTYAAQQEKLVAGQVAMIAQGTWVGPEFVRTAGVATMDRTLGWQALSTSTATATYSTTFALQAPRSGNRRQEQAAAAFLEFASGPAYQRFVDVQKQPPTLTGFTTPTEVPAATRSAYATLDAQAYPQSFAADLGPFPASMSKLINGSADPRQVAGELQAAWAKSARAAGLDGF